MNELIKTYQNADGATAIDGRSLHEFLEVGKDFSTWFKDMTDYGFEEDKDFTPISGKSNGGRPRIDYAITMDMAKELSMIQRTEKGKQARQYFISMEKRAQALPRTPEEKIDLLLLNSKSANDKIADVTERVKQIEQNGALDPGQYNYLSHEIGKAVNTYIMVHHLSLNAKQRALLYKDINHGVNEVTGIRTRSQLRQRHFETACEFVDNWTPSVATQTVIRQLDAGAIADDAMRVAQ